MGEAGGKGDQCGTLWPKNHTRGLDSGPATACPLRDSGLEESVQAGGLSLLGCRYTNPENGVVSLVRPALSPRQRAVVGFRLLASEELPPRAVVQ